MKLYTTPLSLYPVARLAKNVSSTPVLVLIFITPTVRSPMIRITAMTCLYWILRSSFGALRNKITPPKTRSAIPTMASISVTVEKYVVMIAAPSFKLLKSLTVNGVIRLERITPLAIPTAIGIIPSRTRAKIRRRNNMDREMIAKISSTLEMDTSGCPNKNAILWISECRASVSITRSIPTAMTNSKTR